MGPVAVEAFRVERAESAYWATYARNIPTTDDTRETGAVPVAGGYAICLQETSIQYGLGVGVSRPMREDDLRIVDEFYGSRSLSSQLELHPLIAERDGPLLNRWGYRPHGTLTVLEREIDGDPPLAGGLCAETFTSHKLDWTTVVVAGNADAVAPGDRDRNRRTVQVCANAADALVAVRIDGRLAGGGAVGVTGDAAFLFCASTLPEFRSQGVEAALIAARLAIGRSRGATYAFMTAAPDSAELAAAESIGFTATYVRRRLHKKP